MVAFNDYWLYSDFFLRVLKGPSPLGHTVSNGLVRQHDLHSPTAVGVNPGRHPGGLVGQQADASRPPAASA